MTKQRFKYDPNLAELQPWEQQPHEPGSCFTRFAVYRDMTPHDRTLSNAVRKFHDVKPGDKAGMHRYLANWSKDSIRWDWKSRAQAYDMHMDRVRQREREAKVRGMVDRHATIAENVQRKIVERLKTFKSETLSPANLIRWFDVAVKIERLSRGEPTEIQAGTVTQFSAELDLSGLSDEQLDQLQRITSAIGARPARSSAGADPPPQD